MDRLDAEMATIVANLVHLGWIGEDARFPIATSGALLPASFPELVDHLHVFLGHSVALVMSELIDEAHRFGGAFEVPGHDVPADPSLGEMVERRHAASERVRRLVGE